MNLTDPLYSDPNKAREHLERLHWPYGPVCPRCGSLDGITKLKGKSTRPGVHKCNACAKPFTVTVGTIFEDSKIPLNKWLMAFALLSGSKKGFSAHQLHRALGITYKSAWFMAHRIRTAMEIDNGPLGGAPEIVVEADETYVGGKAKNRRRPATPAPKKVVLSLVERDGYVRSFHIANVNAATIRPLLFENVCRLSSLSTDEAQVYADAGKSYWNHGVVNHKIEEYAHTAKGVRWHTNTAENFFSILKRGIIGTYHHVSQAHLARYTTEFDFRYNTRTMTDAERTVEAVKGARGKRLTYRQPRGLAA